MKVICAWCEQEGTETLISEAGLYDGPLPSHGICANHEQAMLRQVRELRIKQNKPVFFSPAPVSRPVGARPHARRPAVNRYLSTAQLLIPFSDF